MLHSRARGIASIPVKTQDRVYRYLAGQFTSLLSTHAVADDEDALAQVVSKVVLVVLAHEADISHAGGLDYVAHAESGNPNVSLSHGKP